MKTVILKRVLAACALAIFSCAVHATDAATAAASRQQTWSVWGGEVGVRWNRDLAGDVGLRIQPPSGRIADAPDRHFERFDVRQAGALVLDIDNGRFRGFAGGSLQARGGYVIEVADGGRIDLTDFRLVPRKGDPLVLDLVSADGRAWFYIDRLMYEKTGQDNVLSVRTMDVRISAALADRVRLPVVAGWAIADMELNSDVLTQGSPLAVAACSVSSGSGCNFAGTAAPNGGTYRADLFMKNFSPQYSRCNGCSGPAGSGTVVFTPSSTLKNNVNAGTSGVTIPGDARGTSSALWAADIPWFQKFSGNFPPYGNDQHPYLIWNLYRVDADGRLTQIGRSGVKHAFLTTNVGSCPYSSGHVLGTACEDTYTTTNNDSSSALGPRSEIIPATNQWGRCGSIYDADCNGVNDNPSYDNYTHRLTVKESQFSTTAHPGSTYLFESWYLARADIDIYNSMGSVKTTQNWVSSPNGFVWSMSASEYKLGPAIDRWVDPANPGANAKSVELSVPEGHAKVAVKAIDLGNGQWRYTYAVMNLDFARAVTSGAEPNLRVLSNKGFDRFSVSVPAGVSVLSPSADAGEATTATNWRARVANGAITWSNDASVPVFGGRDTVRLSALPTLDWGTLYSFSFTSSSPPANASATLHVATAGDPAQYEVQTLGPSASATRR